MDILAIHKIIPFQKSSIDPTQRPNLTLLPSHVRRESNKVIDHLANEGATSMEENI
jgi:hypothetical protein